MYANVYQRGDTLEQVKYKVTKFIFESYNFLSEHKAKEETARELGINVKTVVSILEKKGGEYDEVITKVPKDKLNKARPKNGGENSEEA